MSKIHGCSVLWVQPCLVAERPEPRNSSRVIQAEAYLDFVRNRVREMFLQFV